MKHYFDFMVKRMSMRYERLEKEGIIYFLKDGKVVATVKGDLLNLYFNVDSNLILNHYETAVVSIAKNFKIISNKAVTHAEVICVNGLCGTFNDVKLINHMV